jgi:predicted anti-sigma-YlaC factor YlaD
MNCYKFRDSISLHIDKELSIKDINRFNHHLETCSSCRVMFQGTLDVVSSMKKLPSVTVSPDFGNRLQSRIIGEQSRKET